MNINDITIGQAKELASLFGNKNQETEGLNCQIGEYVIIRTYSAGVWFGKLEQKSGSEVILSNARRMYKWWTKKSISLSGVAIYGIIAEKSKICPPVQKQWLQPIEIISMTKEAIDSLKGAPDAKAE